MSLILTLEHAAHQQARREYRHESGELTIGRGKEASWQIEDPDMLVSRFHCVISGSEGHYQVTDSSRGGLFVDGSEKPLGAGNSATLEDGMRLRMGDYVLRVHLEQAQAVPVSSPVRAETPAPAAGGFSGDDFFSARAPVPPVQPRPKSLPDPFDAPRRVAVDNFQSSPKRGNSAAFDDPFTLDPLPTRASDPESSVARGSSFDDPFGGNAVSERAQPTPMVANLPPAVAPRAESGEREAFFRAMGLDPADFAKLSTLELMESAGLRFRLMVEGLAHLLRNRAQEKQNARVAQTIIGHSDVNPLKFLANVEDMLAALLRGKSPGYLAPETAISAAYRDLAEHNIRSWNGVQAALRRMIDRFDPSALEAELKEKSAIETLLAGGKRAKLWQLYEERYQAIARSAEDKFLGDVGSDFRDAYEQAKGEGK